MSDDWALEGRFARWSVRTEFVDGHGGRMDGDRDCDSLFAEHAQWP